MNKQRTGNIFLLANDVKVYILADTYKKLSIDEEKKHFIFFVTRKKICAYTHLKK